MSNNEGISKVGNLIWDEVNNKWIPQTASSAGGTVTAELSAVDNAVLDAIALAVATEGDALGDGVLIQGDDGVDRTNILVDTEGHIQVDVLSGGGAGTQYTEDAAAAADPVGGALIMVRDDALSGQTTTDGDNIAARGTDKGELYVKHTDVIPVTDNGGALTVDGTVTANLSATDNAVLDTIDTVLDTINAKLVTGTVIGDVNLGATDNAVLDAIDTVLDTINAKLVTGTVIGDVNLGATDNAVLDTIDAVLDTIKLDTAALVTDAAASEVLLGTIDADTSAMVTDLAAIEVDLAAIEVDAAAIEVLLGTIDADTGNMATDLAAIEVDIAALEVDIAAIEVLLGTIDADTGAIKTAVEIIDNAIAGTEMQVDVVAALPAGTNNIGDVDVLSLSNGKTIKRAAISAAASGDNTLVAAVADKKIKVLSVLLVATAAVTVRFESGAAGTALTGVMSLDAKAGFVLPAPADPACHWVETGVNTLLNLELGSAVQVSGVLTYYEEA